MAACLAAPWPSQRRAGNSERHSALARMRERRAGRASPDEEFLSSAAPRPPKMKSSIGYDTPRSDPRSAQPWSPAWTPDSPRVKVDDDDPPSPPRISMPAPGPPSAGVPGARRPAAVASRDAVDVPTAEDRQNKGRPAVDQRDCRRSKPDDRDFQSSGSRMRGAGEARLAEDRDTRWRMDDDRDFQSSGSRVRGPAEARAARGGNRDLDGADEPLPPGAANADFKTLHGMIAKGIQEKEKEAESLEKDIAALDNDDGLRRYREAVRKRREEEDASREKKREIERQRRRKEQEQRERKMTEALELEETEEQRQKEERDAAQAQCRREFAAASRIQARVRGKRSRAGVHTPTVSATTCLHLTPIMAAK